MHLNWCSSLLTLLSDTPCCRTQPAEEILNALNAEAILEIVQNSHKLPLQHGMRFCSLFTIVWHHNIKVICSNCLSQPLLAPGIVPVCCPQLIFGSYISFWIPQTAEHTTHQSQSSQSGLRICHQPHRTRQRQWWNMVWLYPIHQSWQGM